MQLSDQQLADVKEAIENIIDASAGMFPLAVYNKLITEGGGIEIDGVYYGDDDALVASSIYTLCTIFGVEYSIFARYPGL